MAETILKIESTTVYSLELTSSLYRGLFIKRKLTPTIIGYSIIITDIIGINLLLLQTIRSIKYPSSVKSIFTGSESHIII